MPAVLSVLRLTLLVGASASSPSPPAPPPPPAPPCTVEMLRQRAAGDKTWPVKCRNATIGVEDHQLDLSGAHLSDGDFRDATFIGAGAIKLNGADFANADLSGAKLLADGGFGNGLIDFYFMKPSSPTPTSVNRCSLPSLLATMAPPPSTSLMSSSPPPT